MQVQPVPTAPKRTVHKSNWANPGATCAKTLETKSGQTCYRLIFHGGQFNTSSDCISPDKGGCEGRPELWPKYDETIAAQTSFTVSHF